MKMPRKPIVGDRQTAIVMGLAAYALGTLLLWDAYEHRGKDRPFIFRIISGGV